MQPMQLQRVCSACLVIQNTLNTLKMCETIKPSSWDQGGILKDIFVITRTIDDAVDAALDHPAKF
jgi:hypothetical protein